MTETEVSEIQTVAFLELQGDSDVVSANSWGKVAQRLEKRLMHPVLLIADTDFDDRTELYRSQIQQFVAAGYQRFVVLPVGNQPVNHLPIQTALAWLKTQTDAPAYQSVAIHVAHPWTYDDWSELILDVVLDSGLKKSSTESGWAANTPMTNILLAGDGTRPVAQDLALLAFCFQQRAPELHVEFAFLKHSYPDIQQVLLSSRHPEESGFLIMPWRMDPIACSHLKQLAADAGHGVQPHWVPLDLEEHASVLHVLLSKYLSALHRRSSERYYCYSSMSAQENLTNGTLGSLLAELDERIDSMLPSEYQGRSEQVQPTSMGSASLKIDSQGQVAWDQIWTSFCDLAMAGGPPHRGKLLEAVAGDAAIAKPEAYHAVLQEIQRGITLTTGLPTVPSEAMGWVGVVCDDELMASWLLRAIIVENVMVRREKNILFVPAGPDFSVQREIKNVITSVAKTVHYWRAHLRMREG